MDEMFIKYSVSTIKLCLLQWLRNSHQTRKGEYSWITIILCIINEFNGWFEMFTDHQTSDQTNQPLTRETTDHWRIKNIHWWTHSIMQRALDSPCPEDHSTIWNSARVREANLEWTTHSFLNSGATQNSHALHLPRMEAAMKRPNSLILPDRNLVKIMSVSVNAWSIYRGGKTRMKPASYGWQLYHPDNSRIIPIKPG
jgi:hypothetical protein